MSVVVMWEVKCFFHTSKFSQNKKESGNLQETHPLSAFVKAVAIIATKVCFASFYSNQEY
jgi:hypothetical protein